MGEGISMVKGTDKPGKLGFYFFGLPLTGFGLLFLLLSALFLFIPRFIPPNPQMPTPSLVPVSLMMFAFSSFLVTMGVGTILAKRWARKIMLILSWFALTAGLLAVLFFIFFMGSFFTNMANASGVVAPGAVTAMKWGVLGAIGIFYIFLPGVFVLFYQSGYVWKAVQYYDPQENWMDACPTPVFAVSLFSAFGALYIGLFLTMLGFNFPLLGQPIPGWGVALIALVFVVALIYISIGFYHLEMGAWWAALVLVLVGTASTYFIFSRMDLLAMYQQMHTPEKQVEMMQKMGMLDMFKSMSGISWLMMVPYWGYLWFVRRYFPQKG